jgi:hypothetical protein
MDLPFSVIQTKAQQQKNLSSGHNFTPVSKFLLLRIGSDLDVRQART